MAWTGGHTADMRVERVEEPAVFGYTWHIDSCRRTRTGRRSTATPTVGERAGRTVDHLDAA